MLDEENNARLPQNSQAASALRKVDSVFSERPQGPSSAPRQHRQAGALGLPGRQVYNRPFVLPCPPPLRVTERKNSMGNNTNGDRDLDPTRLSFHFTSDFSLLAYEVIML